jgi:hypothetical protein
MASGRVVELCRTFHGHILDASGSLMAMRDNGLNIGLAMMLNCSHALFVTIKLFFPSFWVLVDLRYLALLMIGGY